MPEPNCDNLSILDRIKAVISDEGAALLWTALIRLPIGPNNLDFRNPNYAGVPLPPRCQRQR